METILRSLFALESLMSGWQRKLSKREQTSDQFAELQEQCDMTLNGEKKHNDLTKEDKDYFWTGAGEHR